MPRARLPWAGPRAKAAAKAAGVEDAGRPGRGPRGEAARGQGPIGAVDAVGGQVQEVVMGIPGGGQEGHGSGSEGGGGPFHRARQAGMAQPGPEARDQGVRRAASSLNQAAEAWISYGR